MELTNTQLLRDAIASYKQELVVIVNERAGYAVKYHNLASSRVQQESGLSRIQIDRSITDMQQLIRAGGNCIGNLETYIKAGISLIRWIEGNYTGVQLPQFQVLVAPAIAAVLAGVGNGADRLDKDEATYVAVRIWADLYETTQLSSAML